MPNPGAGNRPKARRKLGEYGAKAVPDGRRGVPISGGRGKKRMLRRCREPVPYLRAAPVTFQADPPLFFRGSPQRIGGR